MIHDGPVLFIRVLCSRKEDFCGEKTQRMGLGFSAGGIGAHHDFQLLSDDCRVHHLSEDRFQRQHDLGFRKIRKSVLQLYPHVQGQDVHDHAQEHLLLPDRSGSHHAGPRHSSGAASEQSEPQVPRSVPYLHLPPLRDFPGFLCFDFPLSVCDPGPHQQHPDEPRPHQGEHQLARSDRHRPRRDYFRADLALDRIQHGLLSRGSCRS